MHFPVTRFLSAALLAAASLTAGAQTLLTQIPLGSFQGDYAYFDVAVNERLVYAYELSLDDRNLSLARHHATRSRTRRHASDGHEQGAFLDGYDDSGSREHGTAYLLDGLGESLID